MWPLCTPTSTSFEEAYPAIEEFLRTLKDDDGNYICEPKTLALQLNKLAKENWHLVSNSKDTPTLKHNVMVTYLIINT